MAKNPNWTKEELKILYDFYETGTVKELENLLPNRNFQGIRIKANRLDLHRLNYFKEEEIEFIKDNYQNMSSREIAKILNRHFGNIEQKAREMGFIKQEFWTQDDSNILKDSFGKYDVEYISNNILKNRTKSSIYHQCQILGLSKETNRYTRDELLDLLMNLSKKLERTPTCLELTKYGLPTNDAYLRCFGSYNTACEILGLDINGTIFHQTKYYYSKNMDICRSKSEQIITNFIIDHNISYKMDKSYKSICKIGDCGRKRYDWLFDKNIVVEYFGLNRHKKYQEKMRQKIELCRINNFRLIQVFDKDILKLEKVFEEFL
jgi:hypothetical protein